MKMTRHGQALWKLTRFWAINTYLAQEEEGLTLIDTGLAGSGPGILAAAAEIGQPIRRIVLTHAHGDHAGALDALRTSVPEADVVLGERTTAFLAGEMELRPDEPQSPLKGSYARSSVAPDRLVGEGERVGSLRVIATPGHSPDHLSFLDERDGTLIAGDAFQTLGGIAVAGTLRWRFPLPALATWHGPSALESARRLHALEPSRLAVGHGAVLEAPLTAMARAVEEAASAQARRTDAVNRG